MASRYNILIIYHDQLNNDFITNSSTSTYSIKINILEFSYEHFALPWNCVWFHGNIYTMIIFIIRKKSDKISNIIKDINLLYYRLYKLHIFNIIKNKS